MRFGDRKHRRHRDHAERLILPYMRGRLTAARGRRQASADRTVHVRQPLTDLGFVRINGRVATTIVDIGCSSMFRFPRSLTPATVRLPAVPCPIAAFAWICACFCACRRRMSRPPPASWERTSRLHCHSLPVCGAYRGRQLPNERSGPSAAFITEVSLRSVDI